MKTTLREYACVPSEKFKVVMPYNDDDLQIEYITFDDPIDDCGDDFEWKYAVCEAAGNMAKMKVGESISFYPERDNRKVAGLIIRVM